MADIRERRKTPRVMVRVLVDYESSETFFYDYSNNLSEGGIYIETDRVQAVGSQITLRFTLPGIDRVFEANGHVTWAYEPKSGDGGPPTDVLGKGMGIQFDSIEPTDKKFIQEYLNKHTK